MKNLIIILLLTGLCLAKVDLASLPERDSVQLTIYNSADLTLARETRNMTMKEGVNSLQFSWANTLIDPTSLELMPKANLADIDVSELTFPARVNNLGLWKIDSEISASVPVEITYFTSGISWKAFYMGTLSTDESTMRLKGYVKVTNNSGEDYRDAQTRLIVGKVNIIDQIASLARRQHPYGSPVAVYLGKRLSGMASDGRRFEKRELLGESLVLGFEGEGISLQEAKAIVQQALSEYYLYTIEGTETILNGWSKRLRSFDQDEIPVVNLYKYEEQRYGESVIRFLSFSNDTDHELGKNPIPGGTLKVYRNLDADKHTSYTGQSSFKYIPVGEEVELNLGTVTNIVVEPKLMDYRTASYQFDRKKNISGWDEIRKFSIEIKNTRDIPVEVEIKRNFDTSYWDIVYSGDFDEYEKEDLDTVKFKIKLDEHSKKTVQYVLTSYRGTREKSWKAEK